LKKQRVTTSMKAPSLGPPFATSPAVNLDKFTEEFEEEMDEILIIPKWFERWERYFKEEVPDQGNRFEELVQ
jgi:hypothetical protein